MDDRSPLPQAEPIKPEDRLSRDRDEVRTSFKEPKDPKKVSRWPTRTVR